MNVEANKKLAELEELRIWIAKEANISDGQAVKSKGNMKSFHSGYSRAMLKISEKMIKILDRRD